VVGDVLRRTADQTKTEGNAQERRGRLAHKWATRSEEEKKGGDMNPQMVCSSPALILRKKNAMKRRCRSICLTFLLHAVFPGPTA
jgi:hypothetical protein